MLAILIAAPALRSEEPAAPGFAPTQPRTLLREPREFDRGTLMAPEYPPQSVSGFSLLNPNRFSMHQSYSVNFASGSYGSSSAGLYLNTLNYKLADPLTLSADVGFHTPLYGTGYYARGGSQGPGFQDPRLGSSLILPHVGLEYRPTESTTFSLHLFNGQDAYKAYGSSMDPFDRSWFR
ncbi:MAG TPA: hypothetical protein VJ385_02925 [Fibrobacteria bacterium]|nr:hypothetical protein [Fibrobacteria bacterium]